MTTSLPRACVASAVFRLLIGVSWLASAPPAWAAAPPTESGDPDRFILHGDRLTWCDEEPGRNGGPSPDPDPPCRLSWHYATVRGTGKSLGLRFPYEKTQYSIQYHAAFDSLWVVYRWNNYSAEADAFEYICRHPLNDLYRKAGRKKIYTGWPQAVAPPLAEKTAGDDVRWKLRLADESVKWMIYTDFAVTGPLSVRQFVLTRQRPSDDENAPWQWSLKVYAATFASSEEPEEKIQGEWKHDETLPVAFREPFTLLTRGDDYYFVTRSGRVFFSAKPGKGEKRRVECVWSDKSRKVVGTLTDAKTNRSFLFCRAPTGERPAYFELAPKPRPVPYGEKTVEFPAYEPMIAKGRTFARALIADGKVKLPAKAEAKK